MPNDINVRVCNPLPLMKGKGAVNKIRLRERLCDAVGSYIVCSICAGCQSLIQQSGMLFEVGENYIMIYNCDSGTYSIICIDDVRLVVVYPPDSEQMPPPSDGSDDMDYMHMSDGFFEDVKPVMGFANDGEVGFG